MTDRAQGFAPTASWENLRARARLLARIRRFFDARGFLEVETPLLSHDTVVDHHLEPLAVRLIHDPSDVGDGPWLWLQTSPEFGMKRLLAAGATAIYQITRAFRGGERGPLHNPEFTMVEWYRTGDDMRSGMRLLDELAQETLCRGSAEQVSYSEAFRRRLGIDPHRCSTADLARSAREHGFDGSASWDPDDRDAWLDWLLATCIEPTLGAERPTIVFDYPASQAALACVRAEPQPVAERFELYVNGVELANGYHELTDASVLRRRTVLANQARLADGRARLPEDSRLLAAMQYGLPPCTGVALGFDRLVMVAVGARRLDDVMAFPIEHA
ncbi:MAG: EF-P lysine aminoacylase GenX [Planctomycetes bacterium]|nr:EF-P lysine aminoacylase GenX [Planctomycetota bacterium]